MKPILITILCAVSTLLSAQTIDFEVTFTKYATVMSENDTARNIHNGTYTVSKKTVDNGRLITIENITSADLEIESVIPDQEGYFSQLDLDILVIGNYKSPSATYDGGINDVFHGILFWDYVYLGIAEKDGFSIEEQVEKLEHIYVMLHYASETDTIPEYMGIIVGSANAYPETIFFNDTANNSANRPSQGIKPSATSGTVNGHEWVDLGLPSGTKWATCNLGASTSSGYGSYYAWGEIATKSSYSNCKTYGKNMPDIAGDSRYDAASANWGANWKMPTKAQIDELLDNRYCVWEWTKVNGTNGYKVTSKENGSSIFLPAAGYRDNTLLWSQTKVYWSNLYSHIPYTIRQKHKPKIRKGDLLPD